MQHAMVDKHVSSRDHLVIWLMSYNAELSEYLAVLGLHFIQPHYANRWFSTVSKETHDTGDCLGNIRLEAATGQDHSPLVVVPQGCRSGCPFADLREMVCQQKPSRKMGTASQSKANRPALI